MKYLFFSCLLLLLLSGCSKNNTAAKVEIYMLESFITRADPSTSPPILSISNAVLANQPLVANADIEWYNQTTKTFKLKTDIQPVIRNYSNDKGFAVVVDGQPVYYGRFHPAILSSMTVGVAAINPMFVVNNELQIDFVMIAGNTALQQLDKRNDPVIINALSASGRLK